MAKEENLKTVKTISGSVATKVEDHVKKKVIQLLKGTGLDLTVASVGGKYNRERLVIEIGILPTGAEGMAVQDLLEDMEADSSAVPEDKLEKTAKKVCKLTGLKLPKCKKIVRDWFVNLDNIRSILDERINIGTSLVYEGKHYKVLGFNLKSDKVVLWSKEKKKPVQANLMKVDVMEIDG